MRIDPASRLAGDLQVPGDKSISHRALICGAGARGVLRIRGLPPAGDVESTMRALRELGWSLNARPQPDGNTEVEIEGREMWSTATAGTLDCGNSGTTMRLLMGAMAAGNRDLTLLGDTSLSTRPMGRVAGPLRLMGCSIELSVRDTAPVRIRGGDLRGIEYTLPVPSAQVKSAVLLAGLQAQGSTTIREPIPTRDHTERLLAFLGTPVQVPALGTLVVESRSLFSDKVIDIPGDLSSAAFLLAAAAILPGSDLRIRNVGVNPTRSAFLRLLETFGAIVDVEPETDSGGEPRGHIRVRAGERRPLTVNAGLAAACIDEIPLVAVLGAVGDGTTVVTGAAELRLKESDRIAMICTGLQRLGVAIQPLADGFVVQGPAQLSPATVHSGGDHRIAMALAVAGLTADGPVHIEGWEAVGVSYPGFEDALRSVVVP